MRRSLVILTVYLFYWMQNLAPYENTQGILVCFAKVFENFGGTFLSLIYYSQSNQKVWTLSSGSLSVCARLALFEYVVFLIFDYSKGRYI